MLGYCTFLFDICMEVETIRHKVNEFHQRMGETFH